MVTLSLFISFSQNSEVKMLSSLSWALQFSSSASISTHLPQWHHTKKFRRAPSLQKVKYSAITSLYEHKPLPYAMDSLEPHMSRETLSYHWGKHHRAHVESLNKLLEGYDVEEEKSLRQFIVDAYNKGNPLPTFDHAAQIWNHEFFWNSMKPNGGGRPSGVLMDLIKRDFGSFNKMLLEFKQAASTQFGSGWAWLVYKANKLDVDNAVNPLPKEEDNKLLILKSPNAVNPLVWDYSPLLGIDIWEHAYYLDYESRRGDYVSVFMNKLVSWEVVSSRLEMAMAQAQERARQAERNEDEEIGDGEAVEVYLDSESDASDAE